MQDLPTSQCLHTHHANGIYEFVLLHNTRQAVDDYIALIEPYFVAVERGELREPIFHMLIELREVGMPPIAYLSGRYRDLMMTYKAKLPDVRVVSLYQGGFMVSILRAFLTIMPERHDVHRRFLHVTERAAAEAWLMDHQGVAEANASQR
jgi:hypothetical protein